MRRCRFKISQESCKELTDKRLKYLSIYRHHQQLKAPSLRNCLRSLAIVPFPVILVRTALLQTTSNSIQGLRKTKPQTYKSTSAKSQSQNSS